MLAAYVMPYVDRIPKQSRFYEEVLSTRISLFVFPFSSTCYILETTNLLNIWVFVLRPKASVP